MSVSPFTAALLEICDLLRDRANQALRLDPPLRAAFARANAFFIPATAKKALADALERIEQLDALAQTVQTADAARDAQTTIASVLELLAPFTDSTWCERALASSLSVLKGVGAKRAALLDKKGFSTISDLLFHLPSRYDDRRSLLRVGDLQVGAHATFIAKVQVAEFTPSRMRGGKLRRVFEATVGDETGTMRLKWFHGGERIKEVVASGVTLRVTGDVRRYRFHKEIIHPEVERIDAGESEGDAESTSAPEVGLQDFRQVTPDYPSREGVNVRGLRFLIHNSVTQYADLVSGHLPDALVRKHELPSVADALKEIHLPDVDVDLEALLERRTPAHARLVIEELYLLEVGLMLRRAEQKRQPGIVFERDASRVSRALENLPFALTSAQRRVLVEISQDLAQPHPMHRLVQGDVGSGKTAVAFLASLAAVANGYQAVLMAPTELLAEQHERSLRKLAQACGETELRMACLTASRGRDASDAIRARLASGEIDFVIGTHALIQDDVKWKRLALCVIDEQHRFGVAQRKALMEKGPNALVPHVLVMTATPIPRTLAMTLYGDLDLSVIDELPPGRSPVVTDVLRSGEGPRVVEMIRATLARAEQVYVVYPLVEESEKIDLRSAMESTEKIKAAFPQAHVDLVHGRLDARERAEAMERFMRGETQILVSTTVIEVGVDVPNATLMIVEHAERFGLAQLHQLRGRVGRGAKPGTCLLIARKVTEDSEARLRAMIETTDGFKIADADLKIRGPGEFLGTRQSGHLPDFKVADLLRDSRWIAVARSAATETVKQDPQLKKQPELARAVELRWGAKLSVMGVG